MARSLNSSLKLMAVVGCLLSLILTISYQTATAQEFAKPTSEDTQWIWNSKEATSQAGDQTVYFRLEFDADEKTTRALLVIHCDNHYRCWLNGTRIGEGHDWHQRDQYEISALVKKRNVLAVKADNDGISPAGLSVAMVLGTPDNAKYFYSGQAEWKTTTNPGTGWKTLEDDTDWKPAIGLGPLATTAPWAGQLNVDNVVQQKRKRPARAKQEKFHLLPTDRLTFLGNTFIERLQKDARLETQLYLHLSEAEAAFQIRNLGWSGDDVWGTARAVFGTVDDGMSRLIDDLTRTEPTVIAVCYGANESFAGPDGLPKFREGFQNLLDSLCSSGAQVVVITPPPFETLGTPLPDMMTANQNLQLYCETIRQIAQSQQCPVIDLNQEFSEGWRSKSTARQVDTRHFTENGIHLNQAGYRLANSILLQGFLPDSRSVVPASEITEWVRQKNELYFHRYRPQNETYLFLFRKHEQGNNAVEIPQFDKLVNETETRIRKACSKK